MQDSTGQGTGYSQGYGANDPVSTHMRERINGNGAGGHAHNKGCGCQTPYIGDSALTSYVEAEAARIRNLGDGCNRMFLSDYLGCSPLDRSQLCRRRGFAYTNDAGARSRGARITGTDSGRAGATLNPGSAFEVLRQLDALDLFERRRPVTDAQSEAMSWAAGPPARYAGAMFPDPATDATEAEVSSGVGVLLTMTPKSGFSGPATANIKIRLEEFVYGAVVEPMNTYPFVEYTTAPPDSDSPVIPAVEYGMKVTFEREIMIFVPFFELIAARGRPLIASCGYIVGWELEDTDIIRKVAPVPGTVTLESSDVFANVDARLIGSGSQMLPEALALLTVGKAVVDGGV